MNNENTSKTMIQHIQTQQARTINQQQPNIKRINPNNNNNTPNNITHNTTIVYYMFITILQHTNNIYIYIYIQHKHEGEPGREPREDPRGGHGPGPGAGRGGREARGGAGRAGRNYFDVSPLSISDRLHLIIFDSFF